MFHDVFCGSWKEATVVLAKGILSAKNFHNF